PESIDNTDQFGRTALWWATSNASVSQVKLLLAHGADANISDLEGTSPFHVGAVSGSTQVLKLLHDWDAQVKPNLIGHWPIQYASCCNEAHQNLDLLLRWGCDTDIQDIAPTLLHECAYHDAYRNAELLLQYGANANLTGNFGEQLWQTAVIYNSENTIIVLLRHGSDLTECTPQRKTVLHLAAQLALQPVVDVLEEADLTRVDADAVDEYGYTADERLAECLNTNHRRRPGCSLELHHFIQRLINSVRAANHKVYEISDAEESAWEYESEDVGDDGKLEWAVSDDGESLYEDALEA
ncbi:hypothetical protein MMC15_001819, partial [Xylographa vitiligo]|nr:hypothetical protein [Xylographa vitiligo]